MFLHIGKNNVIKEEQIIGIFDVDKSKNILEEIKKEKRIIKVSEDIEKTLILIKRNEEVLGYLTNISSNTLAKRVEGKISKGRKF